MKKIVVGFIACAVFIPVVVTAAVFQGGDSYTLGGAESVASDLYAAGGMVSLEGTVNGDAVVAGGTISILGNTAQSILAAGGNLNLNGTVGDDIRAAGGSISVSGNVRNDVIVAGGQIVIQPDAMIGGDAVLSGGSVTMNGRVRGQAIFNGGQVTINGTIDGPVTIKADSVVISRTAVIAGDLSYQSPRQATIENGAEVRGNVSYTPVRGQSTFIRYITSGVLRFLMIFAAALVVGFVFKRLTYIVASKPLVAFWLKLLRGFLFLIITPIISIILFITVVGVPLGFVVLIGYVLMLILSYIFAPIIIGSLLNTWLFGEMAYDVRWQTILFGTAVFVILSLIPVIGWLVNCVFVLVALGTLYKQGKDWVTHQM